MGNLSSSKIIISLLSILWIESNNVIHLIWQTEAFNETCLQGINNELEDLKKTSQDFMDEVFAVFPLSVRILCILNSWEF